MRRLVLSISLGTLILFSLTSWAFADEKLTLSRVEGEQQIVTAGTRAPCVMAKHNGVPYWYFPWIESGDGIYTYFNPEIECGWPTYPFVITDVSFTLHDPSPTQWPVSFDIVVYDLLTAGDSCGGPGTELHRYSMTADSAHYSYPTMGTYNFPPGGGCYIDGPAFIGLEYTSGAAGSAPSIVSDSVRPDTCDQWILYNGTLNEWNCSVMNTAGYMLFTVGGKTTCTWVPGDEYKMHYPQLPNPAGWDVMATEPINLADDWLCTETGWVRDIHWWGAWLDNYEVPIDYFWLSIHEDIPANPPAQPYSMPGAALWERIVIEGDFVIHDPPFWYEPAGWFDPWQMLILPENHDMFWQYDVCLDGADRFWQEEGTIYWLCITAAVSDPSAAWGWRSTLDHWNDDAVIAEYPIMSWYDLWEPPDFMTSLDLAFVITGSPPAWGACCYQDSLSSDRLCIETTVDSCLSFYNGNFLGPEWPCDGSLEACCLFEGICIMADVICCVNEFGGMPQGPGSVCTALEACCLADGSCLMCDPICCDEEGGVPQGAGTVCTEPEACCLNNGDCIMVDPLCCDEQGGVPQGAGTVCTEPEACCLENGDCIVVDPLCCIDQNGTPLGPGTSCSGQIVACCLPGGGCMDVDSLCCDVMGGFISPYSGVCLGDVNNNNVNDACEEPFGACCLEDGSCQFLTQTDCTAIAGATYLGNGTICRGDSDDDGNDDACVDPWPNHKMHFPQLPDPAGWDVMSVATRLLADDWMCTETGWIVNIHWWGSWLDDNIGTVDYFVLGIFTDIPADPPQIPYSRPGLTLWEYVANDFEVTAYDPPTMEGWYDPSQELVLSDNHQSYFRYDVHLPEEAWFPQDSGNIYWLAISAVDVGPTGSEQWGWKSSRDHWNDDACWGEWLILDWIDIWEPPDFEVSLDLAFVIAGEPPCDGMCGDANNDGVVNVSDAVKVINYVFVGGGEPMPVLACGDANGDGVVNVSDAVKVINYVFAGGGPPGDCTPGSPAWYNGDCCPFVPPSK